MWRKFLFCKVLIQCLFLITVSVESTVNYCSPKFCNNSKQHTLCRFRSPEPSPDCVDYERTLKSKEQKEALLDKINSRRNKIASGDLRSFPAAGNMMRLVWNEELEKSAQRWVDQCITESTADLQDLCRDLGDISVGQSIASVYGEAPGLSPLSLVDVWYMELLNVNSSVLPRYHPSSQRGLSHYDYFTQLVWARSSEVGCGSVKFKERFKTSPSGKNRTVYRLVCNFAPSGNILAEPVYSEGPACSKCLDGGSCDTTYTSLCSVTKSQELKNAATESNFEEQSTLDESSNNEDDHLDNIDPVVDSFVKDGNSTDFDYFSEVYDYKTQTATTVSVKSENSCNDALRVDEFVELLKKKLTTDPMFKDLLSKKQLLQNGNMDTSFTDPSVAAFVSKIYSKKEPTTTTKLPDQEYVNSTLLVDLVEAVIFRSGDRTFPTELPKESSALSDINPVKIQAELAEIKLNQDFTGHYFFPEDSTEESAQETTESNYDIPDPPVSDVISEIESIKRDKVTQDFLEEIIDSDGGADENEENKRKRRNVPEDEQNQYDTINDYPETKQLLEHTKLSMSCCKKSIVIKYSDLLQRMASDFRRLRLNERFHCSCSANNAQLKNTRLSNLSLIFILFGLM